MANHWPVWSAGPMWARLSINCRMP